MFIKGFKDCSEFIGADKTILREFLHPDKEAITLRYSLALAKIKPKDSSAAHALKTSEVYYILWYGKV